MRQVNYKLTTLPSKERSTVLVMDDSKQIIGEASHVNDYWVAWHYHGTTVIPLGIYCTKAFNPEEIANYIGDTHPCR